MVSSWTDGSPLGVMRGAWASAAETNPENRTRSSGGRMAKLYGTAATAAAVGQTPTGTDFSSRYSGGAVSMCTAPAAEQAPGSTAYTRPRRSVARPETPLPPGLTPLPGPRVTNLVGVYTSRMPSAREATSSRPEGWNATAPGDSPSPLSTASSVRALGSTIKSFPSANPGRPDATT